MSIKTITLATAAATALGLLTPMAANAQRGGGNIPNGSYAQTCSNISVNNGRLYAECRDTRRGTRFTSLDTSSCVRVDIANDDGVLVCGNQRGRNENNNGGNNGGGWGNGGQNNGGHNNGGWGGGGGNNGGGWGNGGQNNGGNNNGGWGGGGWGGASSIIVYRDSNYRGSSLTFNGEVNDLRRSGLNDEISSMRLRGAWEVCTDANFRGQCMVFDGDVSDLARWRMNDSISSMRPARGGGRR